MAEYVLGNPADDDHVAETAYITKDTYIDQNYPTYSKGEDFEFAIGNGTGDPNKKVRAIIEILIPNNPYSSANIKLTKLKLKLKTVNDSALVAEEPIFAYLLSHSEWGQNHGSESVITTFANAGGVPNKVEVTTLTNHLFETGDSIVILGTTNYNGTHTITRTGAKTFEFEHSWDGDDATGTSHLVGGCSWNDFYIPSEWANAGGDYDTETDYGYGANGRIAMFIANAHNTFFEIDLTALIKEGKITWGTRFSILLAFRNENVNDEVQFQSREQTADSNKMRPYLKIYFENPSPQPPTIKAKWNRIEKKVEYDIEIPDDKDWQQMKLFSNTSTPVDEGDTAITVNYDALTSKTAITSKKAKNIIDQAAYTEDELRYIAAYSEDNMNKTTDQDGNNSATKSNEITFRRPKLSTGIPGEADLTPDTFAIIDKTGADGTDIDVNEEVFIHVTPDISNVTLDSMKKVYIDWGDGGKAEFDWVAMNPTADPANQTTTFTVATTEKLKVGDYICISEDLGNWSAEVRKIIALTETVITINSPVTVDFSTTASIVKTRKHIYTTTGTKAALLRLTNKQDFDSELRAVDTVPDPQPLPPIAIIDSQKLTVLKDEEFILSGLRSISKNMDLKLKWNTKEGPPYIHDGGDNQANMAKDTGVDIKGTKPTTGGWYIINITKNDYGLIDSWTGTDQANFSGGLVGGADFDNGDEFIILQSGWIMSAGTGTATIADNDGAVTTCKFDTIGQKTITLFIGDNGSTIKYDTETINIDVKSESFFCLDPIIHVKDWNLAAGNKVTINGIDIVEGMDFTAAGSNKQTAASLAAGINSKPITHVHAVAGGTIVALIGHIGSLTTDDAAAFYLNLSTTRTETLNKIGGIKITLKDKLATTGFIRRVLTRGSNKYGISGQVFRVKDKDLLESLNTSEYIFIITVIDDSMRKLYLILDGGITITEKATKTIPPDQSDDKSKGTWFFKGNFIDAGVYNPDDGEGGNIVG